LILDFYGIDLINDFSLGANIYGKVRTLFATFTYTTTDLAGSIAKSMEVITQVKK
jgi:hypothetical protein